jgi:hypothetical protein
MIGGGKQTPTFDYHNPQSLEDAVMMGRTPENVLEADPGYQLRRDEGEKAIERFAASKGTLLSGGTLKKLAEYNSGLASQEFNNAFDRNAAVAGVGMNATNNQAALRQQLSEALAGGDFARANQLSSLIGQGMSMLGGAGGIAGAAGGPGGVAGIGGVPLKAIAGGLGKGAAALGKGVIGAVGAIPLAGQIALGAAGAFLLGKKLFGIGNTHEKADTWVQGNQNQFDQYMGQIGQLEKSGQFTPEQAQQARNNTVQQYMAAAQEFAGKGKDQKTVIRQAMDTFRKYYGTPEQYGGSFAMPGRDFNSTMRAMGFMGMKPAGAAA